MIDLPEISDSELYKLKRIFDFRPDSDRLSSKDLAQLSKAFYSPIPKEEFNKLNGKEKEKYTMLSFYRPQFVSEASETPWEGDEDTTVDKIKKSQHELLDLIKGKKLPVGTQRTWKGQDYIKHGDGWVYAGGKHHGKVVGKTKGDITHGHHVDKHHAPGATKEDKPKKKKTSKPTIKRSALSGTKAGSTLSFKEKFKHKPTGEKVNVSAPPGNPFLYAGTIPEGSSVSNLAGGVYVKFPSGSSEITNPNYNSQWGMKIDSTEKNLEALQTAMGKEEKKKNKFQNKTEHYKLIRKNEILKEAEGKNIVFEGPDGYEFSGQVYSVQLNNKVIIKFPGVGFRNLDIESMNNIAVNDPGATVEAKPLVKDQSDGWPPKGFKEPERKGNKTRTQDWYAAGLKGKGGRPATTGKASNPKLEYKSPVGSNCNLVGNVAFGKATQKAQQELNQKLQMTEVLLTDMGIRMKTPMDFICQDMKDARSGVMAQFIPHQGHANDRINLAKNMKTVNKSLLHEIGHGIDYAMEQKGMAGSYFRGGPSGLKNELDELTEVLKDSKFYAATGAKDAGGYEDDDYLVEDKRYAGYLKDESEVFARAFEVYTYSHAMDMVSAGKLPYEYTDHIVPDFLKAGFSKQMIKDPEKVNKTISKVNTIMDKIFSTRAIQKAIQEVDLLGYLRKGKSYPIGSVRTWGGKDYRKTGKGWVPAKFGPKTKAHHDKDIQRKVFEKMYAEEDPHVLKALKRHEIGIATDIIVDNKFGKAIGAHKALRGAIDDAIDKGADVDKLINLLHDISDDKPIFDFKSFEKVDTMTDLNKFLPDETSKILARELSTLKPAIGSANTGKGEFMLAVMSAGGGKGAKGDIKIGDGYYEVKTNTGVLSPKKPNIKKKDNFFQANDKMKAKLLEHGILESDLPTRKMNKKEIKTLKLDRKDDIKRINGWVESGRLNEVKAKEVLTEFISATRDVSKDSIKKLVDERIQFPMDQHMAGRIIGEVDFDQYMKEEGATGILLYNDTNNTGAVVNNFNEMLELDKKGEARIHLFSNGSGIYQNTDVGASTSIHLLNKPMKKSQQDLLETLRKNVLDTDDQGSSIETGNYSNDLQGTDGDPRMATIRNALEDHMYGMDPVEIMLNDNTKFVAVKTDEGVYSGHVKRIKDGEEENILKIEKQTLPTILQYLKAKELIEPVVADKEDKDDDNSDISYRMKILDLLNKLL